MVNACTHCDRALYNTAYINRAGLAGLITVKTLESLIWLWELQVKYAFKNPSTLCNKTMKRWYKTPGIQRNHDSRLGRSYGVAHPEHVGVVAGRRVFREPKWVAPVIEEWPLRERMLLRLGAHQRT